MTKNALYISTEGPKIHVTLTDNTVWLNQRQMAELFTVQIPAINKHLKNIFEEQELVDSSVVSKMETTASDGKIYLINYYNLDAIISVGYRVKSKKATQFRIWATDLLRQHLIDGYTQNTDRLIERKLEIEVKESRDIMSKLIQSQHPTNYANLEAIDLVSKYLGPATDKEAIILKAHLLVERFLITFNEGYCKNNSAFNNSRLSYSQLLGLSKSQFNQNEHHELWYLLNKLNALRNTFSHTLDVRKSDHIIQEFLDLSIQTINSTGVQETIDSKASLKQTLLHLCGVTFNIILDVT